MTHLITCPECDKNLQVPPELLGKNVQCPECKHTFTAELPEPKAPSKRTQPPQLKKTVSGVAKNTKRVREHDEDDDDLPARKSRRPRRYDDDESDDKRPFSRRGFQCPYCGSREPPVTRQKISAAGWVTFVLLLLFCWPLFWIGLLIKEDYRECYDCGLKIGG